MFKTTNDFDNAVLLTLKRLINGEDLNSKPDEYEPFDYSDILAHIVDDGYITGATVSKVPSRLSAIDGNPRITRKGLQFLKTSISLYNHLYHKLCRYVGRAF